MKKILVTVAVIVALGFAVPHLPSPLAPIIAIGLLFIGLPVLILQTVDLGKELRERPGFGRGARAFGYVLSAPQALLGVISIVFGLAIIVWMLYNFLVERQREFTGGLIPSFGVGPALVVFGAFWVRQAFSRSGPPEDPGA